MSVKVSIIIAAYNAERFIERCLESVLSQDYNDWELIIVDDGSTDRTREICLEYAKNDSRIQIKSVANGGVSTARNKGIERARGEYVMFIDSDDELEDGALTAMAEATSKYNSPDILRGEFAAIDGNDQELFKSNKCIFASKKFRNIPVKKFYTRHVRQDFFLWLLWIKRSVIGELIFAPGMAYMEDALFILSLLPKVRTAVYTDSVIYRYRKHATAASSILNGEKINDILSLSYKLSEMACKPEYSDYNSYLAKCADNNIETLIMQAYSHSESERSKAVEKLEIDNILKSHIKNFEKIGKESRRYLRLGKKRYFTEMPSHLKHKSRYFKIRRFLSIFVKTGF